MSRIVCLLSGPSVAQLFGSFWVCFFYNTISLLFCVNMAHCNKQRCCYSRFSFSFFFLPCSAEFWASVKNDLRRDKRNKKKGNLIISITSRYGVLYVSVKKKKRNYQDMNKWVVIITKKEREREGEREFMENVKQVPKRYTTQKRHVYRNMFKFCQRR